MKSVAETLGVARSHLHDKVHRCAGLIANPTTMGSWSWSPPNRRPTYGYRCITALTNRERAKRVREALNCWGPADWKGEGRHTALIRNERMLREGKPDLVCGFPGGGGTWYTCSLAEKLGITVIRLA